MQNFSIFKVQKDGTNTKLPDYRISTKIGDEYVSIGAGWIKESKNGKFISCKLNAPYMDKKGFEIAEIREQKTPAQIDPDNSNVDF